MIVNKQELYSYYVDLKEKNHIFEFQKIFLKFYSVESMINLFLTLT